MIVEVAWGNFLTDVMGGSSVKARGIHDGTVRSAGKLVDEVINTLEHWCTWGITIARETVEGVHDIRAGILHNM